jgi:hypothetical protein
MSPIWTPMPQYPWVAGQPPDARIGASVVAVANNVTPTGISLGTVAYDTSLNDTMTLTSAGVITVPATGVYLIVGGGQFASSSTGNLRRLGFILAGTLTEGTQEVQNSNTITVEISATDEANLNAGDVVQLAVAQNSGGSLNINNPSLAVRWVSSG